MTTKETHDMAIRAGECFRKTVRDELRKKALLGLYVIINCNGKTCRVTAREALKIADQKAAASN